MNQRLPSVSQEADLDREIDILIGKIVLGSATADDRRRYWELSKRRAALMQPSWQPPRRRVKVA